MQTQLSWVYSYSFPANDYFPIHTHEETEIIIFTNAYGIINIDNKKYEYHTGDIAVINPGVPHDELHITASQNILIRFNFDKFKLPTGLFQTNNVEFFERFLRDIQSESSSPKFGYKDLISLKIEELCIYLMRSIISEKYESNIAEACNYLKTNCTSYIDVKEVALDFGFSYESFRHKFKKYYGMSPTAYIINKRLQKAYEMLEKTDKSCTDIAYECGFSDALQFSKMFRRQYGYSPTKMKKNNFNNYHPVKKKADK